MRTGDRKSPIANGKRDSLGRAATYVTCRKHTGARGFNDTRLAVGERPTVGLRGIGPSEDEPLRIDGDARRQPASSGLRTNEDE